MQDNVTTPWTPTGAWRIRKFLGWAIIRVEVERIKATPVDPWGFMKGYSPMKMQRQTKWRWARWSDVLNLGWYTHGVHGTTRWKAP